MNNLEVQDKIKYHYEPTSDKRMVKINTLAKKQTTIAMRLSSVAMGQPSFP